MGTPPPSSMTASSRRIVPHVTADLAKQKLSITEFRLLNLCDGHTTIQDIAEKLGLQFFVAMRMLLDLQKRDLVDFEKRV
jgi:aminopeptidase-like protein